MNWLWHLVLCRDGDQISATCGAVLCWSRIVDCKSIVIPGASVRGNRGLGIERCTWIKALGTLILTWNFESVVMTGLI